MQNSECKMQNYGVCFAHNLKNNAVRHTIILHSALYILHFSIIHGKHIIFKKFLCVHNLTGYSLQIVHPDMLICGIIAKKETIWIQEDKRYGCLCFDCGR